MQGEAGRQGGLDLLLDTRGLEQAGALVQHGFAAAFALAQGDQFGRAVGDDARGGMFVGQAHQQHARTRDQARALAAHGGGGNGPVPVLEAPGEQRPLLVMGLCLDLHGDLLAFVDKARDGLAAALEIGIPRAQETTDTLGQVDEAGIERGDDTAYPADEDIALAMALAGTVDVEFDQPVAFHQGDAHGPRRRFGKDGVDGHGVTPRPCSREAVS